MAFAILAGGWLGAGYDNELARAESASGDAGFGGSSSRLTLSLPGYAGDLSFGFTAKFSTPRTCDLTFGVAGSPSAEDPILRYYSVTGDSINIHGLTGYGDGPRVHAGPVDTRPVTNDVRDLVSFLQPPVFLRTFADRELNGTVVVRVAGDGVEPHPQLGNAGLLAQIACDGPFGWQDLKGGTSVVSLLPASFEGPGVNIQYASYDSGMTAAFELPEGTVHGMLWNGGAALESGSLGISHPGGQETWAFPGDDFREFEGTGGAYHLSLDRIAVNPDQAFALVFHSVAPIETLEDLRTP